MRLLLTTLYYSLGHSFTPSVFFYVKIFDLYTFILINIVFILPWILSRPNYLLERQSVCVYVSFAGSISFMILTIIEMYVNEYILNYIYDIVYVLEMLEKPSTFLKFVTFLIYYSFGLFGRKLQQRNYKQYLL